MKEAGADEPGAQYPGSAVAPPFSKFRPDRIPYFQLFLVLKSPIYLHSGKEVGPSEAAQLKGQRNTRGVYAAFVLDAILPDDDAKVGNIDACEQAEVVVELMMIMSPGVQDPGQTRNTEAFGAFIRVMHVGQG